MTRTLAAAAFITALVLTGCGDNKERAPEVTKTVAPDGTATCSFTTSNQTVQVDCDTNLDWPTKTVTP